MILSFLDNSIYYQDPNLPRLSTLAYLYAICLLSSFLIASDIRKRKAQPLEMPEFTSV